MLLDRDSGVAAQTPEQAQQLVAAGYHECAGKLRNGAACPFFLSPQTVAMVQNNGGYWTCPVCQHSQDLLSHLPWHGASEDEFDRSGFSAGGGTRIGLKMSDQSQIGEDLVENMKELPGYGPITWWHQGGATSPSPLDGATADWGIEVKTLSYDATHHRFVPGGVRNGYDEKAAKNEQAAQMGLKGVLGVLVLLDFRRSVADIYVKAMPLETWRDGANYPRQGVAAFRTNTAQHLVAEVPFKNPFMSPEDPSPTAAREEVPF
jgi:hypothetical protein